MDSVSGVELVVPVESAVPLERLDAVEVVRWLDKDVVVCEVVDVVGMVRSSKFSESEVSTSMAAVPVALLGSTGSISSGGTATSGEASGSDGSSSSSFFVRFFLVRQKDGGRAETKRPRRWQMSTRCADEEENAEEESRKKPRDDACRGEIFTS